MKKLSTLIVMLCLICSTPIFSQINFGLRGGLNLGKSSISDIANNPVNTDNMTGFFIGPTVEATIPIIGIGLDASLLYSQKGSKYDIDIAGTKMKVEDKVHNLEIPINLKYKLSFILAGVYISAGPYFSYSFSGDRDINYLANSVSKDNFFKAWDYGLNIGAGVELLQHLQVGLQYSWGLSDQAKDFVTDPNWGAGASLATSQNLKNRVLSINIAYLF